MLTFKTYPIAKELLIDLNIIAVTLERACQGLSKNEQFFADIAPLLAVKIQEKQDIYWQIVTLKIVVQDYEENNLV